MVQQISHSDDLRQGADKINENFLDVLSEIQQVDQRVSTIIAGGGPDKDPEVVDIRNLDPTFTPDRPITVAGDVTRAIQAILMAAQLFKMTADNGRGKGGFYEGALSSLVDTGMYSVANNADAPLSSVPAILWVFMRSETQGTQIYISSSGTSSLINRVFIRRTGDGGSTWSGWDELIKSSGGTMTGTLMIEGGTLYRSFRVNREVSGIVYGSELSVHGSGYAQLLRINAGVVEGALAVEGVGRYDLNGRKLYYGAGSPEGVIVAPVGSLYLRTDGSTSTTLYVKTSGTGNTGWTAK